MRRVIKREKTSAAAFAFGESADYELLLRPALDLQPILGTLARLLDASLALSDNAFESRLIDGTRALKIC
jgi:hypothetical protein